MRRALQLAVNGGGRVSPNPMVGALIECSGRIIGEGYHAFYGGPHAEVNAINSVRNIHRPLLQDSTIYVTLEPCAHFGKTPPCANLIVATGIPRVVIASLDPNPKVAGKGVRILEDAGIKVSIGMMEKEALHLNRRFIFAQSHSRPFILLKWAQSADGYIAALDREGCPHQVKLSTPLSSVWMHRERSLYDAIMVGERTEKIDNPKLNVRYWGGNSPKKYVAGSGSDIKALLEQMRKEGVTSLMVEGGARLLSAFISGGFFEEIRVEHSPVIIGEGLPAPEIPSGLLLKESLCCDSNLICYFQKLKSTNF